MFVWGSNERTALASLCNSPLPAQRCVFGSTIASSKNIQSWGKPLFEKLFTDISQYQNGESAHFLERVMLALPEGKDSYE